MKLLRFITYLLYKYYSTGPTKDVAHIKAICALLVLGYMNIVTILILLGQTSLLTFQSEHRWQQYAKIALFTSPFLFFLSRVVSKKKILSIQYSESQIKRGNTFLITYIILSCVFLFGSLIFML